ncbi:TRAP transporter small permease subunit [Bosea psychrotolerans]|uniref:TRAP transporter small permease protein n=1 Tax=Bosea psychrotolerans TaxID=1871628 RepID=A0A2S4LZK0_9HYPH|nr:TRAP transporter small permease [Bosea psychrotolerans]POR47769.1 TRAP-type C4-dicarboxylate transport system permease small subunit [Bosea psychrotolerans]
MTTASPSEPPRFAEPQAVAVPAALRALLDAIDRLSRLDGWIGGGCLLALTLLMLCEIGTRFLSNFLPFFPASIPVAWEYSSYLMAASFTFGAAMTLRAGGHVRVTLLIGKAPPALRRPLEALAALLGFAFMSFLTYAMVRFAWGSFSRGQTSVSSDTPIWFPQAVVTFGMLLLTLQYLARVIQAGLGLPLEDHSMKAASPAD